MIFKLSTSEKFADIEGVTDADNKCVWWSDMIVGEPLPKNKADWVVPDLKQFRGENGKRKLRPFADVIGSTNLYISQKAVDALVDLLGEYVELYPVNIHGAEEAYYMMVCIKEVPFDALDREKSTGRPVKYGEHANKGYFAPLETWFFNEDKLDGSDIFILPDSKMSVYVSENFKQRVVDAGLKGFCFKTEFWEENPFMS